MKNVDVDASIIPQVLQYAIWAETNPDSIKSLWLECTNKPDDLSVSWDSFTVRIIIIAPTILRSTLNVVTRINYPVDLIEIKRWVDGNNELLLVNKLQEDKTVRISPTRGIQEYNDEFYMTEYNRESAKAFLKYVTEVESLIREKGWSLETKFNKYYCGFKAGFFNAFGIRWIGSKTFAFFIKLEQERAKSVPPKMTKYEIEWKEAVYYIDPVKTKTADFQTLFEMAYQKFTGT